jgi:hypothetical protein
VPYVQQRHSKWNDVITVDFTITLFDRSGASYGIDAVKFDINNKSFIVHGKSSKNVNITAQFNKRDYNGIYLVDIVAKCYNSGRLSPKKTIYLNLCNNSSPTSNNNTTNNYSSNTSNNNTTNNYSSNWTVNPQTISESANLPKNFALMTVDELKKECRKCNFPVSGIKSNLVKRLTKPDAFIMDLKRTFHQKKYGDSKRFLVKNYLWKNGKVVDITK